VAWVTGAVACFTTAVAAAGVGDVGRRSARAADGASADIRTTAAAVIAQQM
jgi:hypothetical protein